MKKVSISPLVKDTINIPGILKSLEKLADFLVKIQHALGEYLEWERVSFLRFYTNEDLLGIIGNSKSIDKLQKHFKKMFTGIVTVNLLEDRNVIHRISSNEGKEVSHVIVT